MPCGSPVVVFLHGIGAAAAGFAEHVSLLEQQGVPAFAWDQPGYGGTAAIDPYTFETVAAELLRTLDARGVRQCIPVGHSMGGMIAQELYALAPARVAALVLAQTSPAFGSPDGEFQRRFVADRTRALDEGAGMAEVAARLVPALVGPGAAPSVLQAAAALMGAIPADTYRRALAALARFDRRALLPHIAVPTLCLAAEHDRTAAPEVLEKMASRIPGARYECLAGLGHLAPLEDPARFCRAVLSFIRSLS